MKKTAVAIIILVLSGLALQADIIENIIIEGNEKVSRDTILFYMRSKTNDVFSETILKEDFATLWDTGFFSNLRIEKETGKRGVIIRIIVEENLYISTIEYDTGKKVKQEDIVEKLQENNLILTPFSYFNPVKIKKVEKIIYELLKEKGFNQGKVAVETRQEKGQVAITIRVEEGPKTRIGAVRFPGLDPDKVSPGFLRRGMKKNRVHGLISTIAGKDVYKEETIGEDLEAIKLRLQQKGYLEAKVGQPSTSLVNKQHIFGSVQKMVKISIPVELGPRYTVNTVQIDGNKVITSDHLRSMIDLEEGDVYNVKKRNTAIEEIQKLYGALGYCRAQVIPEDNLDPSRQTADLTVRIQEDQICYLGKLEFVGNTYTKDHVIRREWLLREGRRLNMSALEDSIRRMKQLGIVSIEEMPEITPDPADPYTINIKAKVKELQRQMINFNVGYSGYEGWFIALGYSTQNFLGLGEKFTVNLSSGTRAKTYRLAFTEPYLFNLPASLGFELFKTSFRYPSLYTRESQGINFLTSFRFWKYWGASFVFGHERIEISEINEALEWTNPFSYYYYQEGKRTINSISPTIYFSTVDSPLFPSSGTKYLARYRYSGGILGGDVFLHKLKLEFAKFLPIGRKHVFGAHAVFDWAIPFGVDSEGNERIVPFYEKYFLGGERSIRGFDVYRIGPKDPEGFVLGGDKALFVNFEYHIPLSEQLSFVFFYDTGNAFDVDQKIDLNDLYTSLGVELKVYIPMMGVPFRLIFAYNPRLLKPDDSHFAFRFGIGPSFY